MLVPVEDQPGLGTASGSAATCTATAVILSLHTAPKKWLEECFRHVTVKFLPERQGTSDANTASLLTFALGAAATVTPACTGPWLRLNLGPA